MDNKTLTADFERRRKKVCQALIELRIDAALLAANADLAYMTGNVFNGYYYIDINENYISFMRSGRPHEDGHTAAISKPEMIPAILGSMGIPKPRNIALENEEISAREWLRLTRVFNVEARSDISLMRGVRMNKTPLEIKQIKAACKKHMDVFKGIPLLYKKGMTDTQLYADIVHSMLRNGHLGVVRTNGFKMEQVLGAALAGDNAEYPTPYDVSLGGSGLCGALPIGGCGKKLADKTTVLIDVTGNYNGYIVDFTRTYSIGRLPDRAYELHAAAREIQSNIIDIARVGTPCRELYTAALNVVEKYKAKDCFMGTRRQARFVGHGVGLELNELPVLAAGSKHTLEEGMVLAIEPKFIVEGVGAVGLENMFVVTKNGLVLLTQFDEEIIPFK